MPLSKVQFAARIWILVAAAAHQKLSRDARMVLFEILLSIAGIVSKPFAKAHRRIVARITEHDGTQLSIAIDNTEDWNVVVHGTVRIRMVFVSRGSRRTAIHSKAAAGRRVVQRSRLHVIQTAADDTDKRL